MKHGEEGTHGCCNARLEKEGGNSHCCICEPHEECEMRAVKVPPVTPNTPNILYQYWRNEKK